MGLGLGGVGGFMVGSDGFGPGGGFGEWAFGELGGAFGVGLGGRWLKARKPKG